MDAQESAHEILMEDGRARREIKDTISCGIRAGTRFLTRISQMWRSERGARGGSALTFWRLLAPLSQPLRLWKSDATPVKGHSAPLPLRPHPPSAPALGDQTTDRDGRLRGTNEHNDTSALPLFLFPGSCALLLYFPPSPGDFFPSSLSQSPPSLPLSLLPRSFSPFCALNTNTLHVHPSLSYTHTHSRTDVRCWCV